MSFHGMPQFTEEQSNELEQVASYYQQMLMFQDAAAKLAAKCFGICVKTAPTAGLSPKEHACIRNCAKRFEDTGVMAYEHLVTAAEEQKKEGTVPQRESWEMITGENPRR